MSVEAMAAVLHHSRAKGTAKVILLGIANHEGDGGAWPTLNTLARYANVTPRNAIKALRQLEALGEVTTMAQRGGLVGMPDETRPNLYRVTVTCPGDCDGTAQHRTTRSRRAYPLALELWPTVDNHPLSEATPPVATDTPPPVGGDTPPPVGGDTLTTHSTQQEEPTDTTTVSDQRHRYARETSPVDCGQPEPRVPCPPDLAASVRAQLTREEVTTR